MQYRKDLKCLTREQRLMKKKRSRSMAIAPAFIAYQHTLSHVDTLFVDINSPAVFVLIYAFHANDARKMLILFFSTHAT